jgi:hypothetical protein
LPTAAEPTERINDRALGGLDGFEGHGFVHQYSGLERLGGRDGKLHQKLLANADRHADQCLENLLDADLAENGAEVSAIEKAEVFEIDELRQGSPPDHPGREV